MYESDTIVAVATPYGHGGIGIVRLSGPKALPIAAEIFRGRQPLAALPSRCLHHGVLADGDGGVIDEGLAVHMRAPRSYTGEDVVEFQCHGGPLLLRRLVRRCCELGARTAAPGEFTKRAFLNGRIDLARAEAVATLIAARTDAGRRASLRVLGGALSKELARIRELLVDLKARVEASIDFPEEDIDVTTGDIAGGLDQVAGRLRSLLASSEHGRILREGARVVIAGRPNVGKSSLLNALLGSDRAIVTPYPGTTRDTIEETADIGGIPIALSDTAGFRGSPEEIERIGIDRAREAAAQADAVLVVLDRSQPLNADDRQVLASTAGQKSILVLNKSDLPDVSGTEALAAGRGRPVAVISALTGAGLDELQAAIARIILDGPSSTVESLVIVERHRAALARALDAALLARDGIEREVGMDAVAVDIQEVVEHIGSVTGAITTDEVLDRVFGAFCIGK